MEGMVAATVFAPSPINAKALHRDGRLFLVTPIVIQGEKKKFHMTRAARRMKVIFQFRHYLFTITIAKLLPILYIPRSSHW